MKRQRTHMVTRVSVLDALLCRILAWGACGFDMSSEMADAMELANVMEGKPQIRYVNERLTQSTSGVGNSAAPTCKKRKGHVSSVT